MTVVLEVLAGTCMRGAGQVVGKETLMCRKQQAVCNGVLSEVCGVCVCEVITTLQRLGLRFFWVRR